MAIVTTCLCGAKLKVHDKDAGRSGKCPLCGRRLTIGLAGSAPDPRPTKKMSCSECSLGRSSGRDASWEDMPACSGCGYRGYSFTGEPGAVWRNETSRYLYQHTPNFLASCGLCLQYAHHVGPSWPIPWHRGCGCTQKLIRPGDTSLPFLGLSDVLRTLTPAQQDAVMDRNNWLLFRAALVDWEAVVTKTRIREFHEVMDIGGLGVEGMVKAGVSETEARAAWNMVHTAQRKASDESRARMYQALVDKGMTPDQIRQAIAAGLAARVLPKGPPSRDGR